MAFRDLFSFRLARKGLKWTRQALLFSLKDPTWTNISYGALSKEAFTNPVVFAAIMEVARASAAIPWTLAERSRSATGMMQPVSDNHELLVLLRRPNAWRGGAAFREMLAIHYFLSGNIFLLRVGPTTNQNQKPTELHLLVPEKSNFKPIRDMQRAIIGFEHTQRLDTGAQFKRKLAAQTFPGRTPPFTPDGHVLHIKHFTPDDRWYGMSPLAAAAHAVDNNNAATGWNTALLQNAARPYGAFKTERELPEDSFDRLKEQMLEQVTGPSKAGKPYLLEGGMDWKQIGLTPVEMDWLHGKEDAALDIVRVLNVAPELIGIPSAKTFDSYRTALLALYSETVFPFLGLIRDELNNWLTPLFGDRLVLDFDRDAVEALHEERAKLFEQANRAVFLSINEKRTMVGKQEITGGDVILIPLGLVPLATVISEEVNDEAERQLKKAKL